MADINVTLTIGEGLTANVTIGTVGCVPGGDDRQLQYNDDGDLAGAEQLTYNNVTDELRIGATDEARLRLNGRGVHVVCNNGAKNGVFNMDMLNGNDHIILVTGNITIGFANLSAGMSGLISLRIDTWGPHTVNLSGDFNTELNGSDTIDNSANAVNLISWWYDGNYVFYSVTNTV